MGRNLEVQQLFSKHSYDIRPTTLDASHENALVERTHQTIGNSMRAILENASLPLKYWANEFYHFIQLYNFIPHGNNTVKPFEHVTKKRPNLSQLRTFGCRCYVRLPG